ncbi:uncharacterized protein LOC127858626 isoform X2 [Dreissena polymorpha]|uniref:uncharacterized protein LOC127858626 isoform X2 n=1 Tax=Dreissena polymorpha TaxID=45954 RepID=UPI002264F4D1|nr:uncharacterized protein LOC127858626 isoform X2 [Dreissena polymorpha]
MYTLQTTTLFFFGFLFNSCKGSVCGGVLTDPFGVITSPNFPSNYSNKVQCIWIINAPEGYQINVNFTNFALEVHSDCRYDYLELFHGPNDSYPSVGKFCGTTPPTGFKSRSNSVLIVFSTDSDVSARVFNLTYTFSVQGMQYMGCYEDSSSRIRRDYDYFSDSNSPTECSKNCSHLQFFGVESAKHCLCGRRLYSATKRPESECFDICPGDRNQICGAPWRINIYKNWEYDTKAIANFLAILVTILVAIVIALTIFVFVYVKRKRRALEAVQLNQLQSSNSPQGARALHAIQRNQLQSSNSPRDLDPMVTPEAKSVMKMGYSKKAVQQAIQEYMATNPDKDLLSFSAADLVEILIGRQEREEEIPQNIQSDELGSDPMSTPQAKSMMKMGFSKTAVQLAIQEYMATNPDKDWLSFSAADLVEILIGRQKREEEIPQNLQSGELGRRTLHAIQLNQLQSSKSPQFDEVRRDDMQVETYNTEAKEETNDYGVVNSSDFEL